MGGGVIAFSMELPFLSAKIDFITFHVKQMDSDVEIGECNKDEQEDKVPPALIILEKKNAQKFLLRHSI